VTWIQTERRVATRRERWAGQRFETSPTVWNGKSEGRVWVPEGERAHFD